MSITLSHLSILHEKDLRPLVADLSFTLSKGDRMAIIGEEGDGKSTLLKLIVSPRLIEEYASFTGNVKTAGERVAYLPQELPAQALEKPVYAFCAENEAFLECAPKEMSALLNSLRLPDDFCYDERPLKTLSGGEKIKLQLLLLLLMKPTAYLLDEPSNDLDLKALAFLERFILAADVPVLFISHDETLLARTATRILHLEQAYKKSTPRWTIKNVPYEQYICERESALARQEHDAQMERREEKARQERFQRIYDAVDYAQAAISRQNPSGGRLLKKKMKAVKSMEHRFEREKKDAVKRPNIEYAITASYDESIELPRGKVILDFALPVLQIGDNVLARDIALRIVGPRKIVIIGDNGTGKTTLLRILAEEFSERKDLKAAYMPQNYEDIMDDRLSPVEFLHTRGDKEQLTELRTYLGAQKFTAEEMEHPIGGLSGGQKAKLLLLKTILERAEALILDEPTRNLSPLSAPVIRGMLSDFGGAVIAVTHDRRMISEVADEVYRLTPEGLRPVGRAELEELTSI